MVKREHNVIETKADNAGDDLRISEPFPALLAYSSASAGDVSRFG